MAIGTAGYTAMLAVMALERHGLTPEHGPVVVTGAAGGVGSVAIALLAKLGFQVIASTGRPEEADYLKGLGAAEIIDRNELSAAGRPLAKERWAGGDRLGRFHHAREPPVDDQIWRRGRGLRPRRRHGPARQRRAVHFARRVASGHRFRPVFTKAPRKKPGGAWNPISIAANLRKWSIRSACRRSSAVAGTILEGRVRGRIVVKIR